MRFYDLQTTLNAGAGVAKQWTSFPSGSYDSGALDILFDLMVAPGHTPTGAAVISVHGVDQKDLIQAKNFKGSNLSLYTGMTGGLPLSARQPPPNLLINASVLGAFGNWQGTEQSLDLLVITSQYTQENPGNIVFNWQPGQSFEKAIIAALTPAYPKAVINVSVSSSLANTTGQPIINFNSTFNGLAHFINSHTLGLLGPDYFGVSLYHTGGSIIATDFTVYGQTPIPISFDDLIGQPTWLNPPTLTLQTILRADIQIGSVITLPKGDTGAPGTVTTVPTTQAAGLQNSLNFTGEFQVTHIRHLGHFRGTDDDAWMTVIQAVPTGTSKAS